MGRLSAPPFAITVLLLAMSLFRGSQGQSLAIASSSVVVGDTPVNYTFVFTNISGATTAVTFNFGSWSPLTLAPFAGSTKGYVAGSLINCIQFPNNQINCGLTMTGSFSLTLTAMTNPSSTRPYAINTTLSNTTSSVTLSGSLTVATLPNYPLSFQSYSRVLGATSSTISIDFIMSNYIDSASFLSLTYNTTLIGITFPNTSSYTVLQNTGGVAIFSSWNNVASYNGKVTLTGVAITNPQAAISYTVSGTFYFRQGNITYNVQTVSSTITLTVASFTTLAIASPLRYGVLSTLSVTSTCSFTQVSSANASNPAYTIVDYPAELQPTANSTCAITNSTSCRHTRNGTYTLSNFQVGIGNYSATSLTFVSFTFYAGAYYPQCRSTVSINLGLQTITPFSLSSECDSNVSSLTNAINIYSGAQSVVAGDVISISGLKGVITNSNAWTQSTINTTIWQSFILTASNIAVNGTGRIITVPLIYNNPNETSTNTITQVALHRSGRQYAGTLNTTTIPLCAITSGRTIASYSIVPSTYNTYELVNITLGFTMQIFDYAYSDYLTLVISSTGLARQYFLAGPLLNIAPNLTVNGVYCTFTIPNDNTIRIILDRNVTLPTATAPTLTIILLNLVNPPAVDSYSFSLTTIDQPTSGTKEILSSTPLALKAAALGYSLADVYQLVNNSISLVVSNPNRAILSKNNFSAVTTITATLPSAFSCSNFPTRSVSITWNVGVLTSSSSTSGNTTHLTINLGTCFISYFDTTTSFTLSETFSTAQSTSTAVTVNNKCGSCYQCSNTNSTCSACFNSTYTTLTYYYSSRCYTACPSNTYTSGSTCINCHSSCQTCVGPLFSNCTSCSSAFTLSGGYCSSICGSGKYQSNGSCLNCHPNCQSCLSASVCYVCKSTAVLINGVCQFSSCTSPCKTCLGSLTACTSCVDNYYLYKDECLSSCPTGTYQSGSECIAVSESSTYVPVTITGMVCFGLLVLLRVYSSKKIGNESRRRKSYEQEEAQVNYKINLLRVASVMFSWLELAAAIVVLLKNGVYSVGGNAMLAIAIGLVLHFLANMVFLVAYLRMACPKKVENQGGEGQQSQSTSGRHKAIVILSALINLRTYKLLQANLFLDRQLSDRNRQGIPSRKLIRSNSLGDQQQEAPIIQPTTSVIIASKQDRFVHPFLTYLTLADLLLGTLVVIVGAAIQVLSSLFPQMLLWGVDCLLVGAVSLGLTSWDLWVFNNLHHAEQHSEMSSRQQANNTHENLKQLTDFDIKIEPQKLRESPKKQSIRGKLSQRTQKAKPKEKQELSMEGVRGGIKRECDEVETVARDEALPKLKVFQDFDQKDESVLNQKKTKKFSTKNLRRGEKKQSSRRINPASHRRNTLGEVCDDLYINFAADDGTNAPTINATHLHSRRSVSPNRSLQEQSIEVAGEFEEHEQPPNFADISDIQQVVVQPINISLSSAGQRGGGLEQGND